MPPIFIIKRNRIVPNVLIAAIAGELVSDDKNNFLSGLFNSIDIFYYIILTTFFIILCIWRLDAERTYG